MQTSSLTSTELDPSAVATTTVRSNAHTSMGTLNIKDELNPAVDMDWDKAGPPQAGPEDCSPSTAEIEPHFYTSQAHQLTARVADGDSSLSASSLGGSTCGRILSGSSPLLLSLSNELEIS